MQLFYSKDITPNGICTLDPEESRHAVRVLRLREGDTIHVTDGLGHLYQCSVLQANDRACVVEVVGNTSNQANKKPSIHLAVAPTKNPSRMEWLVEKAVEIGVGEITLLQCDHSERSFLKTERLERIALSAMKQSLHLILPKINPAISLREWLLRDHTPSPLRGTPPNLGGELERSGTAISLGGELERSGTAISLGGELERSGTAINLGGEQVGSFSTSPKLGEVDALRADGGVCPLKFIAHCEADKPRMPLASAIKPGLDAVVLIGPEGDFSDEEITMTLDAGFQPVSLGPSRLRTETAALYAVTAFNLINDRQ